MKAFKISLAVIVVAAIAFLIIRSSTTIDKVQEISLPKNESTILIEKNIDSLSKFPDSKFCRDSYDYIKYLIDDHYKPHPPQYPYGRFGKTHLENEQWKENLTKKLYSTYADKFICQAFYVFRGREWENDNLKFIRSEYQTLQNSTLLEKGSPYDKKLTEIQTILSKYDEIVSFISSCKNFTFQPSDLRDRFPISDVKNKILRATAYTNNQMGNAYVNNCRRLHDGLKEIPQLLFRTHIRYLDNKVSQWSGLYSNYNSQSDYVNNLYKPLKGEIDALENGTYKVSNFDGEYERLSNKWNADNIKAYTYKYPTKH